eukprot:446099_1
MASKKFDNNRDIEDLIMNTKTIPRIILIICHVIAHALYEESSNLAFLKSYSIFNVLSYYIIFKINIINTVYWTVTSFLYWWMSLIWIVLPISYAPLYIVDVIYYMSGHLDKHLDTSVNTISFLTSKRTKIQTAFIVISNIVGLILLYSYNYAYVDMLPGIVHLFMQCYKYLFKN